MLLSSKTYFTKISLSGGPCNIHFCFFPSYFNCSFILPVCYYRQASFKTRHTYCSIIYTREKTKMDISPPDTDIFVKYVFELRRTCTNYWRKKLYQHTVTLTVDVEYPNIRYGVAWPKKFKLTAATLFFKLFYFCLFYVFLFLFLFYYLI